jgi:hypothetical protein
MPLTIITPQDNRVTTAIEQVRDALREMDGPEAETQPPQRGKSEQPREP